MKTGYYSCMSVYLRQVPPTLTVRPARKNCSPKAPDKKAPAKIPEKEQGK